MRQQLLAAAALSSAALALCYGARFYVFWIPDIAHMAIGDQSFFNWYAAVILLPVIPVIAALAAWSAAHRIIAFLLAGVCGAFVPLEWRLFREMMQPGIWGDAIGETVRPNADVAVPLVARVPFALVPVLTVVGLACIAAKLFAWCRNIQRSGQPLGAWLFAFGGVTLYVGASAAGAAFRPNTVSWLFLWRACAVLAAIAAAIVAVSAVTALLESSSPTRRTVSNLAYVVVTANAAWNLLHVTYAL